MEFKWESARVGDLFYVKGRIGWRGLPRSDFTSEGPYLITGMHIKGGRVQWEQCFHIPETKFKESPEIVVQTGDIIVTKDGTIGKVAFIDYLPGPSSLNSHLFLVRPKVNRINARFAYYVLSSILFERFIEQQSSGSTLAGLPENRFLNFSLPLPSSNEQSRIAAVLDTVDEAIAKTEAVIAKLKQVRTGLLHDLLSHGLDLSACDAQAGEHGQLRDPIAHPEQFQDSPMGRIPREWRVVQLGEVADIASGVTLGRKLDGGGTLELSYLRVANVQDGYLDLADVKTVRIFPDELDRFRLRHGDVLMNEGGDYDKLGRGTVWEDQIPICLHQNHVFRVRCRPDVLNCYFLAAVSGSETGKRYFLGSSKQSTNLASINSTQLNAFEIPVPSLVEQEAIIKILKVQDDQLTTEARGLVKLHALKSGLMTDLLTGRVRVPEHFGVRRHDAALSSRAHEPASGPLSSEIADESGDASPHSKDTSSRSKGEAP